MSHSRGDADGVDHCLGLRDASSCVMLRANRIGVLRRPSRRLHPVSLHAVDALVRAESRLASARSSIREGQYPTERWARALRRALIEQLNA